jgi:hypothetical protein
MNRASEEADRPLVALREVLTWCAANQNRFKGRHATTSSGGIQVPSQGWAGVWSNKKDEWDIIAITGIELRRVLQQFEFDAAEITTRWAERGWLDVNSSRKGWTKTMRIGDIQIRCYCFKRSLVEMILAED